MRISRDVQENPDLILQLLEKTGHFQGAPHHILPRVFKPGQENHAGNVPVLSVDYRENM